MRPQREAAERPPFGSAAASGVMDSSSFNEAAARSCGKDRVFHARQCPAACRPQASFNERRSAKLRKDQVDYGAGDVTG